MPKFIANGYLLHDGKMVKKGEEIELTEEQAERLGDKVKHKDYEENKPFSEYNVSTLREFAKQRNIEGYSDMRKDELVDALEETESWRTE